MVGRFNQYYDGPPPNGKKIHKDTVNVTGRFHTIKEVVYTDSYRDSAWLSIRFQFDGHDVWTNVVRDPVWKRWRQTPAGDWTRVPEHAQFGRLYV